MALRLGTLAAPFDVLRTPLARAEGLAAEQWLLSGRQHWPRYDWPGADDNARAAAAAAFRAWADDLLASLGSEALDELVGIDVDADLVDQDWDDGDAPMPPLQPVPAFALPLPPGRRLGQGLGLAASAAAAGPAAGPPPPWVREGTVQDHPGDRYQLRAARRSGRPGHASDRVTLDVTLTLDAVRWQGRRRVVLELHQQRRLPLQGLLGDVPAGPAAPGASVTLRGTLNAPASLLQADAAALALWLRYEADEPSTRH